MASAWDTALDWGNTAVDTYNKNPALQGLVGLGLNYYGAKQQQGATQQATNQLIGGQTQGLASLNSAWNQTQSNANPYLKFGYNGLKGYNSLMQNPNSIRKDPGYLFRMNEGRTNLERSAAAKGMSLSGGALAELTKYGQDYATSEYDKALNRRIPMIETGLNAQQNLAQFGGDYAKAIASIYGNIGSYGAAGTMAGADSKSNFLNSTTDILSKLGDFKDALGGPRTEAKMPSGANPLGTSLPGNVEALLKPASLGNAQALQGLATSLGTDTATAALIAKDTLSGASSWANLATGPAARNAASSSLSSAVGASNASKLTSVTNFLSSAPGMGIVAGIITGISTGDWKKGALVGGGTYAGAAIGSAILPGIGTVIGGMLGGLLGGKIGPQPSDKAQGWSLGTDGKVKQLGALGGDKHSPEMRKAADSLGKQVSTMQSTIKSVFPGVKFGTVGGTFGERDGLRLVYGGKEHNYGYDQKAFAKGVAEALTSSMKGLTTKQIQAISKVNFSNLSLAKQQLQYIKTGIAPKEQGALRSMKTRSNQGSLGSMNSAGYYNI